LLELIPSMPLTELIPENSHVLHSSDRLFLEVPQGLRSSMAIVSLIIWYVSSGATLFSNKYILSNLNGDAFSLGIKKIFSNKNISFRI
jgi:hypothetical protein